MVKARCTLYKKIIDTQKTLSQHGCSLEKSDTLPEEGTLGIFG